MKAYRDAVFILISLIPFWAQAHVKWFAHLKPQVPVTPSDLNHASFWGLLALTLVTIAVLVYLDRKLQTWSLYQKLNAYLGSYQDRVVVILRVFTGAALLLSWQANAMIAPELVIPSEAVGWFEFVLALLLLTAKTTPLAGLGMIGLYFYGIHHFGFFHMLDYVVYPAIGYFLLVSGSKDQRVFNTRIPALYMGLGFSLCWAALEKIFLPHWGLEVISLHPALTMGLDLDFFLLASAFVELSLGYLLIIGLLQRPLALTITLVFFTTTAFFGKTEIIGHTILHGALLVFTVVGPGGYYPPPIDWHQKLWLRAAFASVNFLIVCGVLGFAYWKMLT